MLVFQYLRNKESLINQDNFRCGISFALLVEINIHYENTFS